VHKQAFKEGFLEELARRGLTPSDLGRIFNRAAFCKTAGVPAWMAIALAIPAIAGGYIGKRVADVRVPSYKKFINQAMSDELVTAYQRATLRLRRQRRLAEHKKHTHTGDSRLALRLPGNTTL